MHPKNLCVVVAAAAYLILTVLFLLTSRFSFEVYINYEEPWKIPLVDINTPEEMMRLYEGIPFPVIVWWRPEGLCQSQWSSGVLRDCGHLTCLFTDVEHFRNHPNFKGYLFHSINLTLTNLPLPRNGTSVLWGLLNYESPRMNIPLSQEPLISLFNYTATFSRHSDLPTTTQYLPNLQSLTDTKYFETVEAKNNYQKNKTWLLAPVVYIQTDCNTPIDRDSYVAELSKYIRVDSFGLCLHNRTLPSHLQIPFTMTTMMHDDLLYIVGKYKFALAIENAVCEDYITEKLYRPLISGTVPIYIGSPTVADWLPNNRSAILGLDFDSPKHLAEYLRYLDSHDEEYKTFLSHKLRSSVTNSLLIKELKDRNYEPNKGGPKNLVENFECLICEKAHRRYVDEISIATMKHYSCDIPKSILTQQPNIWTNLWFHGRCKAKVIRKFIDSGVSNYTLEEYNAALKDLVKQNKCAYSEENVRDIYRHQ